MNEQAAAWALHALEPDEEAAVLRHLPTCPSCRAVVADAQEALARMGTAVEQVDPPPSLRASLMARVAETPQFDRLAPQPRAGGAPHPGAEQRPVADPRNGGDPRPAGEPRRTEPGPRHRPPTPPRPADSRPPRGGADRPRRGRRLVAAAVALIGVLAIGGLAVRTVQLQDQRDAQQAQAQTMSELLADLARPDTRYALLAQDGGPTVAAVVVTDEQRQVFSLGLPENTVDRDTYVLWGLPAAGNPEPLGTFDVTSTGPDNRPVGEDAGADDFGKYAISIEPGRVAPATPTTVVAVGPVTA